MALNTGKMAKYRTDVSKRTSGGSYWKIPEGESLIYVHPQCYEDDNFEMTKDLNFIELSVHYGVGNKGAGYACLDLEKNKVLLHPIIRKFLSERERDAFKITKNQSCPICEAIQSGALSGERANVKIQFLFGVTPMFFRLTKGDKFEKLSQFEPSILIAGPGIFKDITAVLVDFDGEDITNPDGAILVRVERTGKGWGNTRYKIDSDRISAKNPIKLDKGQKIALEKAIAPGGTCDLFRVASSMIKSPETLVGLIAGVEVETQSPEEESHKSCYGVYFDPKDKECKSCEEVDGCRTAKSSKIETEDEAGDNTEVAEDEVEAGDDTEVAEDEVEAGDDTEVAEDGVEDDPDEKSAPPDCYADYDPGQADCCTECSFLKQCQTETDKKKHPVQRKPIGKAETKPETKPTSKPAGKSESKKPTEKAPDKKHVEDDPDDDIDAILAEASSTASSIHGGKKGKPGRPIKRDEEDDLPF